MTPRPGRRSEAGTTLIELIVAVAIMGIAFVSILGGIGTAIIGADVQRRDATTGLVLASAAEKVVADTTPYRPCATVADYAPPPSPTGFTVAVTKVAYWEPAANRFATEAPFSCTQVPVADDGLQLLQLTLTATSGPRAPRVEVLDVVKRQADP